MKVRHAPRCRSKYRCYLCAAACLLIPSAASAQQLDVSPPLPNVLVLLDTSGSMEKMIDGTDPEANATSASACVPGQASAPNRWGIALQSLTGDVSPYFSCA